MGKKCKWHSQLFLRAEPKQLTHLGNDDWSRISYSVHESSSGHLCTYLAGGAWFGLNVWKDSRLGFGYLEMGSMCGHMKRRVEKSGFAEAIALCAFFATKLIWCDNFDVSFLPICHRGSRRVWSRMLGTLVVSITQMRKRAEAGVQRLGRF